MPYTVAEVGHRHGPTRKGDGASAALLAFHVLDKDEREGLLKLLNDQHALVETHSGKSNRIPAPYTLHRQRMHYFHIREEWDAKERLEKEKLTSSDVWTGPGPVPLLRPTDEELESAQLYSRRLLAAIRPDTKGGHGNPFRGTYDPAINNGCLWQWCFDDPTVCASDPHPDMPWLPYLPAAPQDIREPDPLWLPLVPTDCASFAWTHGALPNEMIYRVSHNRIISLRDAAESLKSQARQVIREYLHVPMPNGANHVLDWAFDIDVQFLKLPLPYPYHFLTNLILQRKARVLQGIVTYFRVADIDYNQRRELHPGMRPLPVFYPEPASSTHPHPMLQNRVGVRFQPGWTEAVVFHYARLGVPVLGFTATEGKPRLLDHSRIVLERIYGRFSFIVPLARTTRSLAATKRKGPSRRKRTSTQALPPAKRIRLEHGEIGQNQTGGEDASEQGEDVTETAAGQEEQLQWDNAQEVALARSAGAPHCKFEHLEQPLPLPDRHQYATTNLFNAAFDDWLLEYLRWREHVGKRRSDRLFRLESSQP